MKEINLGSDRYDDSAISIIKANYDKNILYHCAIEKKEQLHFYSKTREEISFKQASFDYGRNDYVWKKVNMPCTNTIPTVLLKDFSNHFNLEFFQDHKQIIVNDDKHDKYYDNIIVRNPKQLIERYKNNVIDNGQEIYKQIAKNAILEDIEEYVYNYLNKDILYKSAIVIGKTKVMGVGAFNYFVFEKNGYKDLVSKEEFNGLFLAIFDLVYKRLLQEGRIINWYPLSYDYDLGGIYLIEDKTPKRELKKWY